MKVIVGCEFSQIVTKAFRDRGHEAYSCDILPTEGNPEWHFQEDIFEVLKRMEFDLGIFHPPCTRLCNSGVMWLEKRDLWKDMIRGAEFFKELLNAPVKRIAIENPIPHRYALEIIGKKYDQKIQPYEYGHLESKATCLWLKNLPHLKPTKIVLTEMLQLPQRERERLHYLSPSINRWKERSKTFQGIADAMADQWGKL